MAANVEKMPTWAWAFPALASALLASTVIGLAYAGGTPVLLLDVVLLAGTVFAAVHHAEVVAARVGEPFGSLVLAVAVTVIEVALIVSLMLSGGPDKAALARDTVFAAVMIVCNGIVGLCLLAGGARHREQRFQLRGARAALGGAGDARHADAGAAELHARRAGAGLHRRRSSSSSAWSRWCSTACSCSCRRCATATTSCPAARDDEDDARSARRPPTPGMALASLVLLLVALIAVVLLAKIAVAGLAGGRSRRRGCRRRWWASPSRRWC